MEPLQCLCRKTIKTNAASGLVFETCYESWGTRCFLQSFVLQIQIQASCTFYWQWNKLRYRKLWVYKFQTSRRKKIGLLNFANLYCHKKSRTGAITLSTGGAQRWKEQGLVRCCLLFKDNMLALPLKRQWNLYQSPVLRAQLSYGESWWLDHLASCGKLDVEVVFPHQASALALAGGKPCPAHQCSDVHCQTPSTDAHQICMRKNSFKDLNY